MAKCSFIAGALCPLLINSNLSAMHDAARWLPPSSQSAVGFVSAQRQFAFMKLVEIISQIHRSQIQASNLLRARRTARKVH